MIQAMEVDNVLYSHEKLDRKEELYSKRRYWILWCAQNIIFSSIVLIVLSLVMAAVTLALYLYASQGNPIFSQIRCGRNGKPFKLYKFRSMWVDAEEKLVELLKNKEMDGLAFKMKDDSRIIRVRKFIRKTSLDELPQLCNLLTGDMSIIGPRLPLPRKVE